jgi:NitT/TauT family transport system substrate-binding protein
MIGRPRIAFDRVSVSSPTTGSSMLVVDDVSYEDRAWNEGNAYLVGKTDEALTVLQQKQYPQVPLTDLKEQFQAQKAFAAEEWRKLFADGTVTKWLQQVPASQYFYPSLFLEATKA